MMDAQGIVRVRRPVQRIGRNLCGRDFAVGDLHGEFRLLDRALAVLDFDPTVDRLFGVGDTIDRGPESNRATDYLSKPWVRSVAGNHEMDHTRRYPTVLHEPIPQRDSRGRYYENDPHGYDWWTVVAQNKRQAMLDAFARLPIVLEVETAKGIVGLVHADVPALMSWPEFVARIEGGDQEVIQIAIGTSRRARDRLKHYDTTGVPGVYRVFTGHTNVPTVMRMGNVIAMDTAAVFRKHTKRNRETGTVELLRPNAALSVIELTADNDAIGMMWMSKAFCPPYVQVATCRPPAPAPSILALAKLPGMRESFDALERTCQARTASLPS